jgi:hypothetical protein
MEYAMIRESDEKNLRAERLSVLEADHFRNELVLEDAGSAEEAQHAQRAMDDLTRRMAVHRAKLGLDSQSDDGAHALPEPMPEAMPESVAPAESPIGTVSGNIGATGADVDVEPAQPSLA